LVERRIERSGPREGGHPQAVDETADTPSGIAAMKVSDLEQWWKNKP
jgi:hypothetical protein